MLNFLVLSLSLVFSTVHASAEHPKLSRFEGVFEGGELYAGFGLSRDAVAHVYMGKPFMPRDYDFAVVGSKMDVEQAKERLSQFGKIVKVLETKKEVLSPNGNVFAYSYGFVVIIEYEGTQLDFKFFQTLEDAHIRGIFSLDKILFPLRGREINEWVKDLSIIKSQGRKPNSNEVSDPYGGIRDLLDLKIVTINLARAQAAPIDWVVRAAMTTAKLGKSQFDKIDILEMKRQLKKVKYMLPSDHAILLRAQKHKQPKVVRKLLASLGFFELFESWRWNNDSVDMVDYWLNGGVACRGFL